MKELLETKFSVYNKYVAKELGAMAGVMLGELVSEYDYYKKANKLRGDGSFYSSINNIFESTGLTRRNQDSAISVLEGAGILTKMFDKEEGNKRYFKLNPQKIAEYTKYSGPVEDPLYESAIGYVQNDIPFVQNEHTYVQSVQTPLYETYNHKQIINKINNNNNIYNIHEEKNCNADASPSTNTNVITQLDEMGESNVVEKKTKGAKITKKQQRHDEIINNAEFNESLHKGLSDESTLKEIDSLWSEYIELRCSKDVRAVTDGAVKRNLNVLDSTSGEERKLILENSIKRGWTGLFPLKDFEKQALKNKNVNTKGTDERLIDQMYSNSCKHMEGEVSDEIARKFMDDLREEYGDDRIKELYYTHVHKQVNNKYAVKRDWK